MRHALRSHLSGLGAALSKYYYILFLSKRETSQARLRPRVMLCALPSAIPPLHGVWDANNGQWSTFNNGCFRAFLTK
jgi:hypothetical protein